MAGLDPSLVAGALAAVEAAINKALTYDPATAQALAKLEPQVLAVYTRMPDARLFILPTADGIILQQVYEGEITAEIRGSVSDLAFMALSGSINLKDSGVEIIGRSSFVSELHAIFKQLDLDWEELLSQLLGDILGPQAAKLIRLRLGWLNDRKDNFTRLGTEFLTEELRSLASKPELEYFYQQVDELRFGTDRLQARFDALVQKIKTNEKTAP